MDLHWKTLAQLPCLVYKISFFRPCSIAAEGKGEDTMSPKRGKSAKKAKKLVKPRKVEKKAFPPRNPDRIRKKK
jgi:hypothetical protein